MLSMWKAAARKPSLALICILSIALGFSLAANIYHHQDSSAIAAPPKDLSVSSWRNVFEDIADKLAPSVVFITSEKDVVIQDPMGGLDDFFNFGPFNMPRRAPQPQKQTQKATGSGFIVRSDGYILTNNHVVAGADRVTVKLSDGREFKGKVFLDPRTDLALVKIDAKDLPAVSFADSDKVKVGQWTVAIGNPFGLQNTVTVGVVSALRKQATHDPDSTELDYPEAIQTDAAINPGNSGGPLVDLDGKVVGVNFMIYSRTGSSNGIGFAIPSNSARFVMEQLITKGKVVRGYLGLLPADLTPVKANVYGVKTGALVESIDKDSPADKGGLKTADVITKIDGKPVDSAIDLRHAIQAMVPGTSVKLTVVRDKSEKVLTVKLGEAPGVDEPTKSESGDKLGMSVQPLTSELAKSLGIDSSIKGVVVRSVEPGSAAERAGIQAKDVIVEINNTAITSVATFGNATKQLKSGDTAVIVVQRGDRSVILEMPID